jgi:uncharacterized protein DUF3592
MVLIPILGGAAAFGLIFAAIGASMLVNQARFQRQALTTEGLVVALRRKEFNRASADIDIHFAYYATVRFVTAMGQYIEAETRTATNPPPGRVGKTVTVQYDPADPQHFTTTRMARTSGCVAWVFVALGAVFFWVFVASLIGMAV